MTTKTHHFLPNQVLPKTNQYLVLVIDDMPVNRILLTKIFKSSGYAVVEAAGAEEAITMLKSGQVQPDVIVTDVEMPGMDGIRLTGEIRHLEGAVSNIPIIVASGNPDSRMTMEAFDAGADVFLSKPFNLQELREEVRGVIQGERLRRLALRPGERDRKPEINELRTRMI